MNDRLSKLSDSRQDAIIKAKSRFDEFCNDNFNLNIDAFIKHIKTLSDDQRDNEIFEVLQPWIDWLSDECDLSLGSIRGEVSGLNKYLRYHRIKIAKEEMNEELEWPQKVQEERYALSHEQMLTIIPEMPWKYQAFCIGMASAGTRPQELMGTQKRHYTVMGNKIKLEIPWYLTKKRISRTIFFSSEINKYLIPMLRNLEDDDFVWTKKKRIPQTITDRYTNIKKKDKIWVRSVIRFIRGTLRSLMDVFNRVLTKVGLDMRYESTGYHKINLYCFRGSFFTKALRVHNEDTAHAMIGHGAYLQQYQRRTDDEKLELFEELEKEVLIFDLAKKNQQIKKLKEANTKLSDQAEELKEQAKRIKNLERVWMDSNYPNVNRKSQV